MIRSLSPAFRTLQSPRTTATDALSRLTGKTYSDGVTPAVTWRYDTHTALCPTGQRSYPVGHLTLVQTRTHLINGYLRKINSFTPDAAAGGVGSYR